jgi:hypothetical protein
MKRYCTKLENLNDVDTFLAILEATSCVLWSSGKKPTRQVLDWDYCPFYLLVGDSMTWSAGTVDAEKLDNIDFLGHCARSFPIVNTVSDEVSDGEKISSCYVILGNKRKSLLEDIRRYSSTCLSSASSKYYEEVCDNDCLVLDFSPDGPYLVGRRIEHIDTGSIRRVSHAEFLARCIQLSPKKDDKEYTLRAKEEILDMLEMAEDGLGPSSNKFTNAYRSGGYNMLLWVCGLLEDPYPSGK